MINIIMFKDQKENLKSIHKKKSDDHIIA